MPNYKTITGKWLGTGLPVKDIASLPESLPRPADPKATVHSAVLQE